MKNLKDKESIEAFFKAHECDATAEDFEALVKAAENMEGEIPDGLAEAVAGGLPWGHTRTDPGTIPPELFDLFDL